MVGDHTVALIRGAKAGDRDAWSRLVERYYDRWLRRYHANLGSTVRRLYDTEDLVQSAIGDAMRDIPQLQNEGAFFTWVTAIIRHKVAVKRRTLGREARLGSMRASESALCDKDALAPDSQVSDLDGYIRTLDAIIELFPTHPEPMAAVELLFLEGCSVADLVERFGRSKSTIYRWIEEGTGHLKARLTRGS